MYMCATFKCAYARYFLSYRTELHGVRLSKFYNFV